MWHPVRYVLSSSTRLAVTAILAGAGLIAASLWLDWVIVERSTSTGLNSLLIVTWFLLILGVSALEALFIGDIVFPRGWRDHLMQSNPSALGASMADVLGDRDRGDEEDGRRFKSYTIHHSLLTMLVVIGNMLLVGHIGSGALWRIDEIQLDTSLRADDAATRIAAIRHVTRLGQEDELERVVDRVAELVTDRDPDVADAALRGIARIARRMRASVAELRRVHEPQRWEKALLERMRETYGGRLARMFRAEGAPRAAIAAALGGLAVDEALPLFDSYVRMNDRPDPALVRAIVVATGDHAGLHGLAVPVEVLGWTDPALQAMAAWALGRELAAYDPRRYTKEPLSIEPAVDYIARRWPELHLEARCAMTDAFRTFRDGRLAQTLFNLFKATGDDVQCPRIEIERRFGPPTVVVQEGALREKVIHAIASIAADNDEVIDWARGQLVLGGLSDLYERDLEAIVALATADDAER